jgi:hypothetical protein
MKKTHKERMRQMLADLAEHSNGKQYGHINISDSVKVYTCKDMAHFTINIGYCEFALYRNGTMKIDLTSWEDSFLIPDPEKILKEAECEVAKYINN